MMFNLLEDNSRQVNDRTMANWLKMFFRQNQVQSKYGMWHTVGFVILCSNNGVRI